MLVTPKPLRIDDSLPVSIRAYGCIQVNPYLGSRDEYRHANDYTYNMPHDGFGPIVRSTPPVIVEAF